MTPLQVGLYEELTAHCEGDVPIRELGDLELALVGGGCGDVALA